jgi:hypothetical protein
MIDLTTQIMERMENIMRLKIKVQIKVEKRKYNEIRI